MISLYRIDTRSVRVDVSLGGARRRSGEVFLHHGAVKHTGDETVLDLLNDPHPFFPLRVTDPTSATVLIAKSHVHYMFVPSMGGDERIAEARAAATRLEVTIELDDDEELEGTIYAELPQGQQRTLDFVNSPGAPFVVLVQATRDCIVNRSRIQAIRDADPRL